MQVAIERGLQARPTKTGHGDKEKGYAVEGSRLKMFLWAVCISLALLVGLIVAYIGLYQSERAKAVITEQANKLRHYRDKSDAIRMGVALQQALGESVDVEQAATRMFKRINSVVEREFEELHEQAAEQGDSVADMLNEKKQKVIDYVNAELQDYLKEQSKASAKNQERLQKLSKMQEKSLRELLTSVSGVKMHALEDMLEDLFESARKSEEVEMDLNVADVLDDIVDKLYEGSITLKEGLERYNELSRSVTSVPTTITTKIRSANTADSLADALEELTEAARFSRGRKELAAIEDKWRKDLKQAEKADSQKSDDYDAYAEEVHVTVDAMLKVHKLVSDGKVPVHLLDFEAMDLDNDDDDYEDDYDEEYYKAGTEKGQGKGQGKGRGKGKGKGKAEGMDTGTGKGDEGNIGNKNLK